MSSAETSLRDMVDQLRLYGVEVLWSVTIGATGVWIEEHALLILGPMLDSTALMQLCHEALDDVRVAS